MLSILSKIREIIGFLLQFFPGMTMARHLSTQGIKVVTFLPHLDLYQRQMANELALFKLCCKSSNAKLIQEVKELPQSTVDLVVMALDDHELWEVCI